MQKVDQPTHIYEIWEYYTVTNEERRIGIYLSREKAEAAFNKIPVKEMEEYGSVFYIKESEIDG